MFDGTFIYKGLDWLWCCRKLSKDPNVDLYEGTFLRCRKRYLFGNGLYCNVYKVPKTLLYERCCVTERLRDAGNFTSWALVCDGTL